MPAILFSAAAVVALGSPLTDAELARAVTAPAAQVKSAMVDPQRWSVSGSLAGEQMDVWWSEEGLALIAEAVSSAPTLPDSLSLESDDISLTRSLR